MQTVTGDGEQVQRAADRHPWGLQNGGRNHEQAFPVGRGPLRASIRIVRSAIPHPCGEWSSDKISGDLAWGKKGKVRSGRQKKGDRERRKKRTRTDFTLHHTVLLQTEWSSNFYYTLYIASPVPAYQVQSPSWMQPQPYILQHPSAVLIPYKKHTMSL